MFEFLPYTTHWSAQLDGDDALTHEQENMPQSNRTVVSTKKRKTDRLPDWAREGTVLVEWLDENGLLDSIEQRLRIQREGGYVGFDLVLFLLFFFTAAVSGGLKGFNERAATHRGQLAAVGNRKMLASRSSISRVLSAVETSHCETLAPWLLFEGCGAASVMSHPAVKTFDTTGEEWQVFDLDPTTTVLRQRALPEGEDLPPGQRRSAEAKLGRTGRKRGDVQLSRMVLQHAGSALWLGVWLAAGNGKWREHSKAAIQTVAAVCDTLEHPRQRALVRVDGAGGNVPFITACRDAGVAYLTRWSQYGVLDEPALREHLNTVSWFEVIDSGSGPRRQAAEIGVMVLQPAKATLREDGSSYEPVPSRLVVSRFQAKDPEKKRGTGVLIDGWQYELYATALDAVAWPAQEVVTTYYGRVGQENRFGQEDRELGLDRIFSYSVAGQWLASLVGLFVWNLRICRGMELVDPPAKLPSQTERHTAVSEEVPMPVVESATEEVAETVVEKVAAVTVADETPEAAPITALGPSLHEPGTASLPPEHPVSAGATPEVMCSLPATETAGVEIAFKLPQTRAEARIALGLALDRLDWNDLLEDRPGWHWNAENRGIMCPAGSVNLLQTVSIRGLDRKRTLRFLAPYLVCNDCPLRTGCTSSTERVYRKEIALGVPTKQAYEIHALLAKSKGREPPPLPAPPPPRAPTPPRKPRRSKASAAREKRPRAAAKEKISASKRMIQNWSRPIVGTPGTLAMRPAVLLPAELRQEFGRACRTVEVHVSVHIPRQKQRIQVFAFTAKERQKRRLTWEQRHAWNEFPANGQVRLVFAGGAVLARILRGISKISMDNAA